MFGHLNQNMKEQSHTRGKILIESHGEVWGVQVHVNMDLGIHSSEGQMWGYVEGKVTGSDSQLWNDLKVTGRSYLSLAQERIFSKQSGTCNKSFCFT